MRLSKKDIINKDDTLCPNCGKYTVMADANDFVIWDYSCSNCSATFKVKKSK